MNGVDRDDDAVRQRDVVGAAKRQRVSRSQMLGVSQVSTMNRAPVDVDDRLLLAISVAVLCDESIAAEKKHHCTSGTAASAF